MSGRFEGIRRELGWGVEGVSFSRRREWKFIKRGKGGSRKFIGVC